MTSKEILLNILKNYKLADKGNGDFLIDEYQEELLKPIFKDLQLLEEYQKILGTPIQNIMKCLKILEILKKYDLGFKDEIDIIITQDKEDFEKVKEWLDNDSLQKEE